MESDDLIEDSMDPPEARLAEDGGHPSQHASPLEAEATGPECPLGTVGAMLAGFVKAGYAIQRLSEGLPNPRPGKSMLSKAGLDELRFECLKDMDEVRVHYEQSGYRIVSFQELKDLQFPMTLMTLPDLRYFLFKKGGNSNPKLFDYVLAIRGTVLHKLKDMHTNLKILLQNLHEDDDVKLLRRFLQVLCEGVEDSRKVCITGHSSGAGIACALGRDCELNGIHVEVHAFNTPFPDWHAFGPKVMRGLEGILKTYSRGALSMLSKSQKEWLDRIDNEFWKLSDCTCTFHLYISTGDPLNLGYLKYYADLQKLNNVDLSHPKAVRRRYHSSIPLLNIWWPWKKTPPVHLFPNAELIVVDPVGKIHSFRQGMKFISPTQLWKSHSLSQWTDPELQVKVTSIQVYGTPVRGRDAAVACFKRSANPSG